MTKLQTWMMTGLATLALVVGLLLATGALSSAQGGDEATATPTPTATADSTDSENSTDAEDSTSGEDEEDADDKRGCRGGKYLVKEAAAEVLGISEEELKDALREGQTLAEIAEAQGMSVEDFGAALLENITAGLQEKLDAGEITQEQFDEAIGELNENLDDIINSEFRFRFHHRHGDDEADEETDGSGAGFHAPFQRAPFGSGA